MIDFRYHIISIAAVFLALAIGVVMGVTVIDRVTGVTLRGRVNFLDDRLDAQQEQIRALRTERDENDDLVKALAPRVIEGVLTGVRVVFVAADGEDWHADVRDAMTKAGAEDVGSITLTSKWLLAEASDRDELVRAFAERTLAERDPAGDAAAKLGEQITGVDGAPLLTRLSDAGFVRTAPREDAGSFPLPGASVVVLGSDTEVPLGAFARGAARATATLALAGSPERLGPLATLRRINDPPDRLATFDSAADDPAGVGTVLALRAADSGDGGHFGRARGLRFLPALG